jgi:hypothetical protein
MIKARRKIATKMKSIGELEGRRKIVVKSRAL